MTALLFTIGTILAVGVFLSRELSEHGKDSKFPESWGPWWNTKTAHMNKHDWHPIFEDVLVMFTDAEHLFQFLSTVFIFTWAWFTILYLPQPIWTPWSWFQMPLAITTIPAGAIIVGIFKKFTNLQ